MSYEQRGVQRDVETVGFQPQAPIGVVKERVEKRLKEKGLTLQWLFERIGVTKTGYREMWQRESVRVVVLQRIAMALSISVDALLSATPAEPTAIASEPVAPYGKRYLEQRVDDLERDVQALKAKLKR